jgi:hypothetical protein
MVPKKGIIRKQLVTAEKYSSQKAAVEIVEMHLQAAKQRRQQCVKDLNVERKNVRKMEAMLEKEKRILRKMKSMPEIDHACSL